MWENKVDKQIQKIMISLQNLKGEDYLACTIFISGLGILKAIINIKEKKVVDFEKKSFMDMVRKG
jgi:hypothetical protein